MECKYQNCCGFYRKFQVREHLFWKSMVIKYCKEVAECVRRLMFDADEVPTSDDFMPVGAHASKSQHVMRRWTPLHSG